MDAAKSVGIEEEITTVSVPTLKAWIVEQAKESGKDAGSSFIKGTPFDGLVGEYIEIKNSSYHGGLTMVRLEQTEVQDGINNRNFSN